jgi:predicted MPP superfamily phosphohydrolase
VTALAAFALAVAGVAAALALWALWIEPRRVLLRRRALRLPRWPDPLAGLKVGVISDLHAGAPHVDLRKVERVAARLARAKPDLVVLLGDYVDPEVAFSQPVEPEAVAERLGGLRAPLGRFAVLGNHDWAQSGPRVVEALRAVGIRVLENEAAPVGARGVRLWLVGLADPTARDADVEAAFADVPESEPVLVLSHDPDLFPKVPERAALTLSGHTHGGQVDLPGVRAKVIPSRFGDRFAAGHVVEDGRHLHVSRGVGTSRFPVRFRSPPEVLLLRLVPERDGGSRRW